MGRIGLVVDGTDIFVRSIERELRKNHQVDRFAPRFVRLPLIGKRVNDLLLVQQLRWFLQNRDVVFFEWAGSLAAMASCQPGRAKRVVRAHRTELYGSAYALDWSSVEVAIFVSQAMRSLFLEEMPGEGVRTTVIYNGVDLSRFSPSPKGFSWCLGMLGNLTPRKRVYDAVCALAVLATDIPWHLRVGGPPLEGHLDYWHALEALVKHLGLSHRVEFTGFVQEPWRWLAEIDVFISASYSEGHQVALLEAMASGCYCLSHCWQGAEEILPSENIYATDLELRSKLMAYATLDEATKQQAQVKIRATAEQKFDERRMVQETLAVVESMVDL